MTGASNKGRLFKDDRGAKELECHFHWKPYSDRNQVKVLEFEKDLLHDLDEKPFLKCQTYLLLGYILTLDSDTVDLTKVKICFENALEEAGDDEDKRFVAEANMVMSQIESGKSRGADTKIKQLQNKWRKWEEEEPQKTAFTYGCHALALSKFGKNNKTEEAIYQYEKAIERDPDNWMWSFGKAVLMERKRSSRNRFERPSEETLQLFKKAVEQSDGHTYVQVHYALCLIALYHFKFRRSREQQYGEEEQRKSDEKQIKDLLQKAEVEAIRTENKSVLKRCIKGYNDMKWKEELERCFDKIESSPLIHDTNILHRRARYYMEKPYKDYSKAKRYLEKSVEEAPDGNIHASIDLIKVKIFLNEESDIDNEYQKLISLHRENRKWTAYIHENWAISLQKIMKIRKENAADPSKLQTVASVSTSDGNSFDSLAEDMNKDIVFHFIEAIKHKEPSVVQLSLSWRELKRLCKDIIENSYTEGSMTIQQAYKTLGLMYFLPEPKTEDNLREAEEYLSRLSQNDFDQDDIELYGEVLCALKKYEKALEQFEILPDSHEKKKNHQAKCFRYYYYYYVGKQKLHDPKGSSDGIVILESQQENYVRLSRLMAEKGTEAFRKTLTLHTTSKCKVATFKEVLNIAELHQNKIRPTFVKDHLWPVIDPANPTDPINSVDQLDITACSALLNLMEISDLAPESHAQLEQELQEKHKLQKEDLDEKYKYQDKDELDQKQKSLKKIHDEEQLLLKDKIKHLQSVTKALGKIMDMGNELSHSGDQRYSHDNFIKHIEDMNYTFKAIAQINPELEVPSDEIMKYKNLPITKDPQSFRNMLIQLGEIAFEGILEETDRFSKKRIHKEVGKDAFDVGLLWNWSGVDSEVSFLHQSFQENAAAFYLSRETDQNKDEPWKKLKTKIKPNDIGKYKSLLQFCASVSNRLGEQVLQFLDAVVQEVDPKFGFILEIIEKLSCKKDLSKTELEMVCHWDMNSSVREILELEAKCLKKIEKPTQLYVRIKELDPLSMKDLYVINQFMYGFKSRADNAIKVLREAGTLTTDKCFVSFQNDQELSNFVGKSKSVSWIKLEGLNDSPFELTRNTVQHLKDIYHANLNEIALSIGKNCKGEFTEIIKVVKLLKEEPKAKYTSFTIEDRADGIKWWEELFQTLLGIKCLIAANLWKCQIPHTVLGSLGEVIHQNADIFMQLDLSWNKDISSHFGLLSQEIKCPLQLTVLNLSGCGLQPSDEAALSQFLAKCNFLKVLNLRKCLCEISHAILRLRNLKELVISHTVDTTITAGLNIGRVLENLDNLQELEVLEAKGCGVNDLKIKKVPFKKHSKLKAINLDNNTLGDKSLQHICEHVDMLKELRELQIEDNDIGNEGVQTLFRTHEQFRELKDVHIGYNRLTKYMTLKIKETFKDSKINIHC